MSLRLLRLSNSIARKYISSSFVIRRMKFCSAPTGAYTPGYFINPFRYDMLRKDKDSSNAIKTLNETKDAWPSLISMVTAISAADGDLTDVERDRIYTHFVNAGVIDKEAIKDAISRGSNVTSPEYAKMMKEFVDITWPQIQERSKPHRHEVNIITTAIYFAMGDGLHQKETAKANEIALKLGMTQEKFDKILQAFAKERDLFDEYYGIFVSSEKQ